jgi:hypothetical protein
MLDVFFGLIKESNHGTISSLSWFSPWVFIRMMPTAGRDDESPTAREL